MNVSEKATQHLTLEGKVAIVTGAASGIGQGIAVVLAEMGASLCVVDIDDAGGVETVSKIAHLGGKAVFLRCDVRSHHDCAAAVKKALETFGRVNILCNNAGIVIRKTVPELQEADWDAVLGVTLKGVYLMSREVIPHMIRAGGGSIINTGSGWSLRGGPRAAAYCAAKAGVLNLTRAMAIDHGKDNIRVNCVCPGDIDTPMLRNECLQLGQEPGEFLAEASKRPIHRIGSVADVANAVLFLASDMSKWITGAHLVVDGGGLA